MRCILKKQGVKNRTILIASFKIYMLIKRKVFIPIDLLPKQFSYL